MNYIVGAEVHKKLENGFRLKVDVTSLGLYINGFRVLPGKNGHKWWVIPPQQKTGPKNYIDILEFDKTMDLWIDIQNACIGAVEDYYEIESIPELTREQHDKFMSEQIDKKFKDMDDNDQERAVPWLND